MLLSGSRHALMEAIFHQLRSKAVVSPEIWSTSHGAVFDYPRVCKEGGPQEVYFGQM